MNGFQRIKGVLAGLVMLAVAALLIAYPYDGKYMIIVGILSLGLTIGGIKNIIFYFRMARHMVGGKLILVQGVIILDLAFLTGSLTTVPRVYILLYLIVMHAFYGIIEVLRAMESKRAVEGPWKLKFGHGLVNFTLSLACLVFIRYPNTAVIIYSLGLIYSAVIRIISSFRRTTFIFIE